MFCISQRLLNNVLNGSIILLPLILFSQPAVAVKSVNDTPQQMLEIATKAVEDINTTQLKQQLLESPKTVLIDVRTQFEIKQTGTIGVYQNINIPRGWMEFRIKDAAPDLDTPIVVYCGTNRRSPLAALTLKKMGYSNVKNYASGYFAWHKAGNNVSLSSKNIALLLYQAPKMIIKDVYSAIGATQPSTYENSGHNNNLSFIVGDESVLVFNAGGSYLLAQAMHSEIKKITDKPIQYVVLENAQGHAVLGSEYWKQQGAQIIAHDLTPEIIKHTMEGFVERAQRSLKDKYFNTHVVMPDRTFSDTLKLDFKGKNIVLNHFGSAHSPDDIQLLMPDEDFMISGDFAFNERLLPILEHTDIRKWLKNWEKLEALNPKIIVPGHGDVTDMATVRKFTKGYLSYMLKQITDIIDDGGSLLDAYDIDQSEYRQWKTYRQLSRQNADRLFRRLEFE